ncbi:hypothetical protein CROQUDRAFT_100140 [Cronartium quercuum f. sp. fusiforme G11]|uniref:Uncharacterized protein n=1 Tax=Cronartium quercuum f. sp. fusiforme G11 TaxID=708437 RepID=A0A9P6N6H6_9BASI|nr:hypothetical protein CROQUDRAFT_100140 [Cronartium quercuum f. sp. fusiforme G11]
MSLNPFVKSSKIPWENPEDLQAEPSSPSPSSSSIEDLNPDNPKSDSSDIKTVISVSTAHIMPPSPAHPLPLLPSLFDPIMSNDMAQENVTTKLTILGKGSFIRWKHHLLNHLTTRELDQYVLKVVPIPIDSDIKAR